MRRLAFALAACCAVAAPVSAAAMKEYVDVDHVYSFEYPGDFVAASDKVDGTGNRTGVSASSMENGDVVMEVTSKPAGKFAAIDDGSMTAFVDQYREAQKENPRATFISMAPTTMLGAPAADMVFEEAFGPKKDFKRVLRIVATVSDGKEFALTCIYGRDKESKFAPACDHAAKTLKLLKK